MKAIQSLKAEEIRECKKTKHQGKIYRRDALCKTPHHLQDPKGQVRQVQCRPIRHSDPQRQLDSDNVSKGWVRASRCCSFLARDLTESGRNLLLEPRKALRTGAPPKTPIQAGRRPEKSLALCIGADWPAPHLLLGWDFGSVPCRRCRGWNPAGVRYSTHDWYEIFARRGKRAGFPSLCYPADTDTLVPTFLDLTCVTDRLRPLLPWSPRRDPCNS